MQTGSRSDPSSASPRESGKAEHRAFGGPPCPGGGAHPSGRHPVFTRVVAHPCATWAIFPGHGVLGELQGRGFDQRGDLGKGQAVAVFRLLHSSRQPDRSKRCNDRSHAPDAPGGRRPVAMGVERHRDVPRSRAEAGTPARATTPMAAERWPLPEPVRFKAAAVTLRSSRRIPNQPTRSEAIHPQRRIIVRRCAKKGSPPHKKVRLREAGGPCR